MKSLSKTICLLLAVSLLNIPALAQGVRRAGAGVRATRSASPSQRLRQVNQLFQSGETEKALAAVKALAEEFPESPEVSYKSYELNLALSRLSDAQKDLQAAIDRTSNEAVKAERQQKLEALKLKQAEAERLKKEAEQKSAANQAANDDKLARWAFIQNRINDGNLQVAGNELGKLAAAYPSDPDLLFKASEVAARLEQFEAAERWLNSSIELTADPATKGQRRQQVLELKYRREQAEATQRRQELAVRFKKLSLMASDGKSQEVGQALDALLAAYKDDPEIHFMAHEVYVSLGDFVAAEYHLKKSVELSSDARTKNERELKFLELNHQREKAADMLIANVDKYIADMNYPEAAKAIKNMDNIVLYHQHGWVQRGGLLGLYRQYEEAAKTYNQVLQDTHLSPALRTEVTALRDYCVKQVTDSSSTHPGMKRCHFCHAEIPDKAAYCHKCMAFQYPIGLVRWKNTRVNFNWANGRVESVNYHYENRHTGSNFLSVLSGVANAAAVGAGSTPGGPVGMSLKEAELVDRNFSFKYEDGVPQGVRFNSSANGGEVTTMELQGATTSDPVWVINEKGGGKAAFKVDDILIYPNNPKVDSIFGQMAFKQNLTRGFAPNWNFDPTMWSEPHIFVMYYDDAERVTRAVDALTYSDQPNAAGHSVADGRKQFTGPDSKNPLNDPVYRQITYNPEGLVSSIIAINDGKETYRRDITYSADGIVQEKEIANGKVVAVWNYHWKGGKLVDAAVDNKNWKDQTIVFQ